MLPDYGRSYRALYEAHWWWRARERWILRALARRRPPRAGGAALDIGCGDGLFFDRLAALGYEVEGVESDAALVDPRGAHRARITVGPFDERFRPGKRYALIVMLDVLEHLHDPLGALRHAVSLLEPDGVFLATVPAFMALWTTHDVLNQHVTRYTRRALRSLAERAGMRVDHARYFFHWLAPLKLVQRGAEAVTHPAPRPPRVPPSWINRSLYGLSLLEQRALGALPLPFGSSLLLVGGRRDP